MQARILIVDDDPQIRRLLSEFLDGYGFSCKLAADGEEMRRVLAHSEIDVIILDLMLPGENGLTLCRQLRANSEIPIIMVTARGELSDRWHLNPLTRLLTSPAQLAIPLSNAEFRLLWAFIERPRCVLNRDQLLDAARGRAAEAFDRSIDLLVSRLRQKLQEDPRLPRLLKTVRGEGYLFDAEVSQ
jgi:two-component system OmpR family response regulator